MTTLIVGGGLSGLALAEMLQSADQDFLLLEARNRFGGRIKTEQFGAASFDMGPAWFWPGQPRIAALIDRLDLEKFDQFSQGLLSYEDEKGNVQRGRGFASMRGSWRLQGGLAALTQALADRLPENRKRLNARVEALAKTDESVTATLANGEVLTADRVVLALPPRLAANLTYTPSLPDQTVMAMHNVATWMAGQAKAVAVYRTPFWRDAGLSGDASSRVGPMVEIHDASPQTGGSYALFGFIGVSPQARADELKLRQHIVAQLVRLFGKEATTPEHLYLKDWAADPNTSTQADLEPLYAHPNYGLPSSMERLWDDKLCFAGTEVAPQFGGYLEGALEAAEIVLGALQAKETSYGY